jgi:hypothetical protein
MKFRVAAEYDMELRGKPLISFSLFSIEENIL